MKFWLVALMMVNTAWGSSSIPPRALNLMPTVVGAINIYWPDLLLRSFVPAQIEQETCVSLTSRSCWSSKAELKTSREYGFGLAQLTLAYNKNGSVRFNAWEDVKKLSPDLKNWVWADRYNPELQIKAMVIKNSVTWRKTLFPTHDGLERLAFTASEYNGGSTYRDRQLCARTNGCDPTRWFHTAEHLAVADVSYKSKTAVAGYGKSFYEINRSYVVNILQVRNKKYIPFTG